MAGTIDNMQQHIGIGQRFQRGMEGIHQRVRQVADETDGIGNDNIARPFDPQLARGGVESGK